MKTILIAGSGKMARNIGEWLLDAGLEVLWVSENQVQCERLEKLIVKKQRHMQRLFPADKVNVRGSVQLLSEVEKLRVDLVIESTSEDLLKKRRMLDYIEKASETSPMYWSNSSSLAPETIKDNCIGTHFFYPLGLTKCVELLFPPDCGSDCQAQVQSFFKGLSFTTFVMLPDSPFVVNRMLLPLQSGCVEAVVSGYSPEEVNTASTMGILPMGQLQMMDSIGLDTVCRAVREYTKYRVIGDVNFSLMESSLTSLIQLGKLGVRNNDGLMQGQPLPWARQYEGREQQLESELTKRFVEGVRHILAMNLLSEPELKHIGEQILFSDKLEQLLVQ